MKSFIHFIQYHNFTPFLVGLVFLSAGAALAANEDARGLVYTTEERLVSVDNTYLLGVVLEDLNFDIVVDQISEDSTHYYVEYSLGTVTLVDGVWREATTTGELVVDKRSLRGGDLGFYIEGELAEIRAAEIVRLTETQSIERTIGKNRKIVATEYGGLFGRMLDPKQKIFPDYDPVVKPPVVPERPPSNQLATQSVEQKKPEPTKDTEKKKPNNQNTNAGNGGTSGDGAATNPSTPVTPTNNTGTSSTTTEETSTSTAVSEDTSTTTEATPQPPPQPASSTPPAEEVEVITTDTEETETDPTPPPEESQKPPEPLPEPSPADPIPPPEETEVGEEVAEEPSE